MASSALDPHANESSPVRGTGGVTVDHGGQVGKKSGKVAHQGELVVPCQWKVSIPNAVGK